MRSLANYHAKKGDYQAIICGTGKFYGLQVRAYTASSYMYIHSKYPNFKKYSIYPNQYPYPVYSSECSTIDNSSYNYYVKTSKNILITYLCSVTYKFNFMIS